MNVRVVVAFVALLLSGCVREPLDRKTLWDANGCAYFALKSVGVGHYRLLRVPDYDRETCTKEPT